MSAVEEGMARGFEEIAAAKVLAREGFAAQAVSRCYYAAFYAAEAALLSLGESRSKHAGVISAFGQLVIKGEGVDERAGRLFRSLYDRRSHADYDLGPVPQEVADQAIEDAETVVGIIGNWLEQRPS
ncbi:MAG TPA: HEPN domain-containing protein [Acidimicrobiia bacterium]|nr:HEPN domain-containing protein [Acidimicrobiia bacterium]